ncbi:MAG: hypothetical protein IJQ32_04770 [Paludibacteraceae bacterium]|nr:hypothetical protein [Paludibacteraceae bacterium]
MSSIFDGNSLTFEVTTPTAATVSSNTSKSNAKAGKLGSDGHYFEIILKNEIFTAASINGYINTTSTDKNWAFQFSTDGGTNWSTEVTQANDGNKTAHDIAVGATIPANANGFRVVRRAGTSTMVNSITLTLGSTGPSTDATLKSIVYGGDLTPVPGFKADQLSYEVELPATEIGAPSVQATANDSKASINYTQATTLPGTAKIDVTAEDGTTKLQYTVTFTKESANPKVESATWANIRGTATIDQVNLTITGQVLNGSSLTVEPQFTGKYLNSYTPLGAQDFSQGPINYTFQASTGETTTYAVTITESPAVSSDATLKSLTYGGTAVPNFSPSTYVYNIELTAGIKTPPTIAAVANDAKATMEITQAQSVPGSGKVVVTAEDETTSLTYTINYTIQVPPSSLTIHVPEIYEAKEIAGGYNGTLAVVDGHEYETFYINRDNSSNLTIAISNVDKIGSICDETGTSNTAKAKDGWFTVSCNGTGGDTNAGAKDEFQASIRSAKFNSSSHVLEMHIQGYDQFSFYGNDNNQDASKNKMFEVYIDDVKQTRTPHAYSINRIDLTTSRHIVRLTAIGGSDSKLCSFSLRVAQEPRTKWLKGNDSTQKVNAHGMIAPITYVTKYNNIAGAETKLEWLGTAVDGISLQKIEGELTDTLMLTGTANAPAGEYKYAVVAYYNGVETSRATGSFFVKYQIKATTETDVDAEQGDEMDEVKCRYYVYDETTDIIFKWINDVAAPGVTTKANNGTFTISGTPTTIGTYSYLVTVTGGDTVSGIINVKSADLGVNPILYLYKNTFAYNSDYIYTYLKQSGYNLKEKKAKANLRPTSQYAKYKWILISEDVDADNPEVFQLMRGSHIPVLNMKAFSYSHTIDSLQDKDGYANPWGEANNGSLNENGKSITVLREDHPIFQAMHKKQGDKIQVLDSIDRRGLMPIKVTKQGSLCLATALTRDREDYFGDGAPETFLHEYPTGLSGNDAKYICFPIAMNSSMYLTAEGKDLLNKVIQYLTNEEASVAHPDLYITKFKVGEAKVTINEGITNTITVEIDTIEHPEMAGITKVIPETEVADPHTHIVPPFPALGDTLDLSIAQYLPVDYVVTDYIHRKVYEVTAVYRKPLGIEEVEAYSVGQWVNVYDIYGRKVATTNEDIYTMSLPRGIYIIVTENGQTLKISR